MARLNAAFASPAWELFRYTLAGATAVITHVAVLTLLVELFSVDETVASATGFACALPVNYYLQHRFVFHSSGDHAVRFQRYVGVTLSTLVLNVVVFWVLIRLLHINYVLAQLMTTALVFVVNYVVNRAYTFASLPRTDSSR